jgi:hypothetical protein
MTIEKTVKQLNPAAQTAAGNSTNFKPVFSADSLQPGDIVKVVCLESMIIDIFRVEHGFCYGQVILTTRYSRDHNIESGDHVRFEPAAVIFAERNGVTLP